MQRQESPDFAIQSPCIAVVVPCFRVRTHLARVLETIGPEVSLVYCVDDACPDGSGAEACRLAEADARIRVLVHRCNQGVGGAVLTGYRQAIDDGADIVVKIDGDGQMDPAEIPHLVRPILAGEADYVKGNRFFRIEGLRAMPWSRLVGNAGLSFLSKLSTGYWNLFDPTNGYTAIHAAVARLLPFDKISRRYFFESDLLFRLNTLRAVVTDVPMEARYGEEKSNLSLTKALFQFPFYHLRSLVKRIFYNYFLRNFNMASLHLVFGLMLLGFGAAFGIREWVRGAYAGTPASAGTVMLAGLPVLLGVQFLLNFVSFDMASAPRDPIHRNLHAERSPSPGRSF